MSIDHLKQFRDRVADAHLDAALRCLGAGDDDAKFTVHITSRQAFHPGAIESPRALPSVDEPPTEELTPAPSEPRRRAGRKPGRPRGTLRRDKPARLEPVATAESEPDGRKGSGRRSEFRAAVLDWISRFAGPFTVADLPPVLRADAAKTSKLLSNLGFKGLLKRGEKRGQWLGGRHGQPLPPGALAAVPVGKRGEQRAAIEVIALRLGAKAKWSAGEMEEWVRKDYPSLVATASKCSDLRVRMIDMASEGLLIREGSPPFCTYRLGPKLTQRDVPAAEAGPALKIAVPRDPDASREDEA